MIDSYSFGNIVIDGKAFTSDCIVAENSVNGEWWRKKSHELSLTDIKDSVEREKPEVVVVGKGKYGLMKILKETHDFLKSNGIELISGNTDEAVKIYNRLSETKKVLAFLHLTC